MEAESTHTQTGPLSLQAIIFPIKNKEVFSEKIQKKVKNWSFFEKKIDCPL